MIIVHSSYRSDESLTLLGKSLRPALSANNRVLTTHAKSLKYAGVQHALTDIEVSNFTRFIQTESVVDVIDKYAIAVIARIPGFDDILKRVVSIFSTKGVSVSKTDLQHPSLCTDVFGYATLTYLRNNRSRFNVYNDVLYAMMLSRENHQSSLPSMGLYNLILGNGYIPDPDGDFGTDAAVGLGQWHRLFWTDMGPYLGMDPAYHRWTGRYAAGRFPWWLQALLSATNLQRAASRFNWLRSSDFNSSEPNPTMIACSYPYLLFGQPKLWRRTISAVYPGYLKKSDQTLTEIAARIEGCPTNLIKVLTSPLIGGNFPNVLFNMPGATSSLLFDLVSGGSNISLAEYYSDKFKSPSAAEYGQRCSSASVKQTLHELCVGGIDIIDPHKYPAEEEADQGSLTKTTSYNSIVKKLDFRI